MKNCKTSSPLIKPWPNKLTSTLLLTKVLKVDLPSATLVCGTGIYTRNESPKISSLQRTHELEQPLRIRASVQIKMTIKLLRVHLSRRVLIQRDEDVVEVVNLGLRHWGRDEDKQITRTVGRKIKQRMAAVPQGAGSTDSRRFETSCTRPSLVLGSLHSPHSVGEYESSAQMRCSPCGPSAKAASLCSPKETSSAPMGLPRVVLTLLPHALVMACLVSQTTWKSRGMRWRF